jgi:hypothetical protein
MHINAKETNKLDEQLFKAHFIVIAAIRVIAL